MTIGQLLATRYQNADQPCQRPVGGQTSQSSGRFATIPTCGKSPAYVPVPHVLFDRTPLCRGCIAARARALGILTESDGG